MSKKYVLIGLLLLLLSSPLGLSHAAIFTENFNSATGTGLLQNDLLKSEKWDPTNYYVDTAASLTGWTFSSTGAYVATNSDASDKAILLNESPGHGTMLSPIISVNPAGLYLLTFNHWGDNRASTNAYTFSVSIDGISQMISRIYTAYGTGTGISASIPFTATGNSIQLLFSDNTTTGQASAIIDNITISAVPIPAAVWLLGSGLLGLVVIRRKFRK